MTREDLIIPCSACTQARDTYDMAWYLVTCSRGVLSVTDETMPADGSRIHCERCKDRREVLTKAGEALVEFVRKWAQ